MCPFTTLRDALQDHRAVVCLAVVVLLAGCGGIFGDEPELANGDEAAQQFGSLDSYNATVTLEFTDANGTTIWTGKQVVAPGTNRFYERLDGPDSTTLTVSNGSHTWLYTPDSGKAQKLDTPRSGDAIVADIRQLVEEAHAGETSNSEQSIRLLPFVPDFSQNGAEAAAPSGPRQVTHEGIETVAGRDAHVVTVEHVDGEYTVTHYLDTEYYIPLKTTGSFDGGRMEYTLTYEDVEFEPDLPPGFFEFTPPDDTDVDQNPFEGAGYESPAEIEAVASMAVPEPEVPAGFSLAGAERFVPGAETVELTYTSERGELVVAKTNVTLQAATPDEQVDIGGRTAAYTERADHNSVTWTCDGNYYSVRGDLDRELLLGVASSVTCA